MVISEWVSYGFVFLITIFVNSVENRIDEIPNVSGKDIIVTGALNAGGFITTEKKAQLSGLRIETDPGEEGFLGYNDKGISIVQPDTEVRIVLFGWWLDEVITFGFTSKDNCSQTPADINQADFTIQTEKRVVIRYSFEKSDHYYKVCMKQKPRESKTGDVIEMPYSFVDDVRTYISTDIPPRIYYFPMALQISIITVLLVLSGLFSGLNLGLMALSPQELTLISKSGSPQERIYAETILPIRKSGNLLLCSLLIGNVMVNSAISILFDDLTSGYVALIVSSAGIVIFGEIFPQSLCVKKGLAVGARTIWITRFFMVLTFPLAYPISRILDCVLGDEVVSYDRKRLMELIKLSTRNEDGLAEELKIAVGAMEISDKTVADVMTKMNDVFMLSSDTVLNTKTVAEILRMGYTRIPIFENDRNNIVSLLFVKDLALLDPDDNFTIKTVCGYHEHALRFVYEDTPLRVMLEEFKKGEYHLAMVQRIVERPDHDPVSEVVGVVTLEDIVEEILQAEIVDETDAIMDNVHRTKRRRAREDFTHFLVTNENSNFQISMQLQFVTIQWLTGNVKAFGEKYINRSVLEKIIRQNVRKVEFSQLNNDGSKIILPRHKIYNKKQPSDKMVLILEGRMVVTIGQTEMNFEAGSWHFFGLEILDKIIQMIESGKNENTGAGTDSEKKITFTPDFSVTIQDDCTYLEITAQTYLLAYKTTLLSRESKSNEPIQNFGSKDDISTLEKVTVEPITEESPLLMSNGGCTIESLESEQKSPGNDALSSVRFVSPKKVPPLALSDAESDTEPLNQ
uniref:CNNM transmembrane domain-containing protein n=1 Tax=Panagrolaimus sp. JU765 TaxID=591449 RepID=A0AC34RI91_9BILA